METTIKGLVSLNIKPEGTIEVNYKRSSLILGLLAITAITVLIALLLAFMSGLWTLLTAGDTSILVLPPPFMEIAAFYIPVAAVLVALCLVVQVSDRFTIDPKEGLMIGRRKIAFKDISAHNVSLTNRVGSVSVVVRGEEVVVASLLKKSVAQELAALVWNHAQQTEGVPLRLEYHASGKA